MNSVISIASIAGLTALSGCCTPIPLIAEPLPCPIANEVIAESCPSPTTLPAEAAYGALVRAGIQDRNALQDCARHDKLLADTIRECNMAIAKYREVIKRINEQSARKR